ncbi:hypothetical protein IEQ34_020801 [Dendrobium chrysotoxum]|uniref:R13L1/DRL21-like LRR repeat region domain-containing protein n=1 Tax=Dendrobium chrysotoxum TaxID=161865 RepID=A0AAV7G3C6_DENCH|nr:hypothetical protein IEQ34_020801 [Dendrobium chrysotoxum]
MRKITLLKRVYEDEITEEFDPKRKLKEEVMFKRGEAAEDIGGRIGKLNSLRQLDGFYVKNEDVEEACSAKLCDEKWNFNFHQEHARRPSTIKMFKEFKQKNIYMGAKSTIWMNNVNSILNLEKIKLTDCMEWETLPPFEQLPFLKSLKLDGMPKVKWLENKFNGK